MKKTLKSLIFGFLFFLSVFSLPQIIEAATLSIGPSSGSFSVGSTFTASILLNTQGESVNALEVVLSFPPDMLQVVSPSTGQSVIGVWTASPKFDNKNGRIELQGGIPGGITASNALVSTITFRVKSVGQGMIKFLDKSRVLLNDGLGTNALKQTGNAVYEFRLPPPAGPQVVSTTNPDQATWYPNKTVILSFAGESASTEGYSYILSREPTTMPDDISEGKKNSVSYTNLADGVHYFHVKSLRGGIWGGTTHFAIKVDSTAPSEFQIDIAPSARTTSAQPVIQFLTTDALSGMDHYDLKIVPLSTLPTEDDNSRFFIEAESPYVPSALEKGSYDVIVRAYDKAGNYQEITDKLRIVAPMFAFIGSFGIQILGVTIPWKFAWFILLLIVGALGYLAFKVRLWRHKVHVAHDGKQLPQDVVKQLEELKQYRAKYGVTAAVILCMLASIFGSSHVDAQTAQIAPPLVTSISKNISNEEIFYLGGKTDFANEQVLIYLQNLATGETFSQSIESDNKGDWFYRHTNFLSPGNYLLWAQSKLGEELSPPGPQVEMRVTRTAVQFGGGKLSYEALYLVMVIALSVIIVGLLSYILYHYYHGRKRHLAFRKEIASAEESIRRGFAVLKRDIEAEIATVRKANLTGELSQEEQEKEKQLLSDLEIVRKRLGREIWEIKHESTIT